MFPENSLYKFCSADGAIKTLSGKSIFITSPLDLNDPFEMRPSWTQEHQEIYNSGKRARDEFARSVPNFVLSKNGPEEIKVDHSKARGTPISTEVETHRGLSDVFNKQVFNALHQKFRVCCFSREVVDEKGESDEKAVLMWAHYADSFQGACVVFDPHCLYHGIVENGVKVDYSGERVSMPPYYYGGNSLFTDESLSFTGRTFSKSPESKWFISGHNKHQLIHDSFIKLLSTKSPAWRHEKELRFIYDMEQRNSALSQIILPCAESTKSSDDNCSKSTYRDCLTFAPSAIKAVILGHDILPLEANKIISELNSESGYSHVSIFWTSFSSSQYRLQYTEDTPAGTDSNQSYAEFMQTERANAMATSKGHERIDSKAGRIYVRHRKKGELEFSGK